MAILNRIKNLFLPHAEKPAPTIFAFYHAVGKLYAKMLDGALTDSEAIDLLMDTASAEVIGDLATTGAFIAFRVSVDDKNRIVAKHIDSCVNGVWFGGGSSQGV